MEEKNRTDKKKVRKEGRKEGKKEGGTAERKTERKKERQQDRCERLVNFYVLCWWGKALKYSTAYM